MRIYTDNNWNKREALAKSVKRPGSIFNLQSPPRLCEAACLQEATARGAVAQSQISAQTINKRWFTGKDGNHKKEVLLNHSVIR
jgi:hypothetical protein